MITIVRAGTKSDKPASQKLIVPSLLADQVFEHYRCCLMEHVKAQKYLLARGINFQLIANQGLCGFVDRTLYQRLPRRSSTQRQYSVGLLQEIGLLKHSGHQLLTGAVVFPLRDGLGRIRQIYGRRITPRLKPEVDYYPCWSSTTDPVWFPSGLRPVAGNLIVCKSPLEASVLISKGLQGVVSPLALELFDRSYLVQLYESGAQRIVWAFDIRSMRVVWPRGFKRQVMQCYLCLPAGDDLSSCVLADDSVDDVLMKLSELGAAGLGEAR